MRFLEMFIFIQLIVYIMILLVIHLTIKNFIQVTLNQEIQQKERQREREIVLNYMRFVPELSSQNLVCNANSLMTNQDVKTDVEFSWVSNVNPQNHQTKFKLGYEFFQEQTLFVFNQQLTVLLYALNFCHSLILLIFIFLLKNLRS